MRLNALHRRGIFAKVEIPKSEPHMQRALVFSLLCREKTTIKSPHWSPQTEHLLEVLGRFGLKIIKRKPREIILEGVGEDLQAPGAPVCVAGSATACGIIIALSLLMTDTVRIHGDRSLMGDPLDDFLEELEKSGLEFVQRSGSEGLELEVTGSKNLNPSVSISERLTFPYASALLMVAPMFGHVVRMAWREPAIADQFCMQLTIGMMRRQQIEAMETIGGYRIEPGAYMGGEMELPSDFASLSHLAEIALIARESMITISEYQCAMTDSEKKFFPILNRMGLKTRFYEPLRELVICKEKTDHVHLIVDAGASPSIVPAVIAMAPFVAGCVRVHGVSHAGRQQGRLMTAMIGAMQTMGFKFSRYFRDDDLLDGFSTQGPQTPCGTARFAAKCPGGKLIDLLIASMGTDSPAFLEGDALIHPGIPPFFESLALLELTDRERN